MYYYLVYIERFIINSQNQLEMPSLLILEIKL